jgi:acyl-CoA reductase-like NAD-dependent aldehyde dehydrogenase
VAPTVLTGTREEMKAVQEEIFGPVVAAAPFNSDKDILPPANNTNYGLGAGVFTRDDLSLEGAGPLASRPRDGCQRGFAEIEPR